ncbi:hypothetical protein BGX26_008819, partial [Mortierella sp. AD094]
MIARTTYSLLLLLVTLAVFLSTTDAIAVPKANTKGRATPMALEDAVPATVCIGDVPTAVAAGLMPKITSADKHRKGKKRASSKSSKNAQNARNASNRTKALLLCDAEKGAMKDAEKIFANDGDDNKALSG